jgi:hypothetical protein
MTHNESHRHSRAQMRDLVLGYWTQAAYQPLYE